MELGSRGMTTRPRARHAVRPRRGPRPPNERTAAAKAAVASLAISAGRSAAVPALAVATRRAIAVASWPALRRRGLGRLLEGVGDDVLGDVEVFAQVLDALILEEPVVVLPGEALGDELLRGERLHQLDHLEVAHALRRRLDRAVLAKRGRDAHYVGVEHEGVAVGVAGRLLGDDDALLEEVGEDGEAVLLGDEHDSCERLLPPPAS